MDPEILEGKLEALPRDPEELDWFEVSMLSVAVACCYLMCILLVHAAILGR
jgi:hypothetical protein